MVQARWQWWGVMALAVGFAGVAFAAVAENGTDLNGTDLNGTDLNGTDLNGTTLNGISFSGVALAGLLRTLDESSAAPRQLGVLPGRALLELDALEGVAQPGVAGHLLRDTARDSVPIGQFRHAQPPSA